jgi:hypothetical protein
MSKTCQYLGDPSGKLKVNLLKELFLKFQKNYGIRTTTSLLKAYYNEAVMYSLDLPVRPSSMIWCKRSKKSNLPIPIQQVFGKDLKGSVFKRRLALSYLRCYESITLQPVDDLESVIQPSDGAVNFQTFKPEFEEFLNSSPFAGKIKKKFDKFLALLQSKSEVEGNTLHFSGKSGISGKTILTASIESKAIEGTMKDNLIAVNEIFHKKDFKHTLEVNQQCPDEMTLKFNKKPIDISLLKRYLGRITFVSDKGGKTRLVAIGNYWVQETFGPIHDLVYGILRELKEDGTYKQEDSFDAIRIASAERPVWSFDLSKATDRFPLEPQHSVIRFLHPELGDLWDKILRNLNFEYKGNEYYYKVGQPMGLLSSWAVFALTHHFIIQYCAFKNGIKSFHDYRVLGDDVAIWHPRVAKMYKEIITKLDVQISEFKSIQPNYSSSGPACAEFAKRLSYFGVEMTPISPEQSRASWKKLSDFPLFISWLLQRGYDLGRSPVSLIMTIGRLSIYERKLLVVLFFFWGLMRGPVMDLSHFMTFELENSAIGLRLMRINRLEEAQDAIDDAIYDIRGEVRKSLDLVVPNEFAFVGALRSRVSDIRRRLDLLYEDNFDLGSAFAFSGGRQLSLSELEYLPDVTVDSIINGLHQRLTKQQALASYLKLTAKTALKEIDFNVDC